MGTLKSRRMCSGHAVHIGGKRFSYTVFGGRSEGRRSYGKSKRGWNILTKIFNKMDGTMFSV